MRCRHKYWGQVVGKLFTTGQLILLYVSYMAIKEKRPTQMGNVLLCSPFLLAWSMDMMVGVQAAILGQEDALRI